MSRFGHYRGFDTLGEEFMLLCAVTGAVLLLRGASGEDLSAEPGDVEGRETAAHSDPTALLCRVVALLAIVFGLHVALHATVTPGGGFQRGVIVASGLLLLYLGEGYRGWRRLVPSRLFDAFEGGGAALFAGAGLVPMLPGRSFLYPGAPARPVLHRQGSAERWTCWPSFARIDADAPARSHVGSPAPTQARRALWQPG